ncbi:hypothetical protein Pcaca03_44190 [Pectobacterium carotovorum subsp. carotovorum]|uniref:Uncharacterized protein n=1 Tax=Pectobacterium carotovorum subsp. carotovorum TaxID=555 RepID=A0AAI9PH20_PECCC|nr:hypothetical protein SOASR016_43870 [Pectobacterium carotovorum subsp. carotovorum]GLV71975.1 hypothetical protein Pcaca03_44190 [Pectobacterium carotovorum subsp. carotovorum]
MNIGRLIQIESGLPSFGKLAHYTQIGWGSNKQDEMILTRPEQCVQSGRIGV